jgi:hypothetical protein
VALANIPAGERHRLGPQQSADQSEAFYPGEAKTDRRDAYILADTARTRRKQVH